MRQRNQQSKELSSRRVLSLPSRLPPPLLRRSYATAVAYIRCCSNVVETNYYLALPSRQSSSPIENVLDFVGLACPHMLPDIYELDSSLTRLLCSSLCFIFLHRSSLTKLDKLGHYR